MNDNKLIKSNQRVKAHREVFTPVEIVDFMVEQPEIDEELNSLTATFFEPAAGEGAFLTELLKRKMQVAMRQSKSKKQYDENVLLALMSLYGVELLQDNVEMLVMNMIITFKSIYEQTMASVFSEKPTNAVLQSAKTIIMANMVQGNTLTKLNDKGEALLFSEWQLIQPSRKDGIRSVQRSEYTLDSILADGGPSDSVEPTSQPIEFDLFAGVFEDEVAQEAESDKVVLPQYVPSKITEVYKEETYEVEP